MFILTLLFTSSLPLCGRPGAAPAPRTGHSAPGGYASGWYRRGGRWDKDIGRPVGVGEEGEELAVGDDGSVQRLGVAGPEIVVPKAPATVIPANVVNGITVPPPQFPRDTNLAVATHQLPAGAIPAPSAPPPAIRVPAPTSRPRYALGEPDEITKSTETLAALERPIQFDDRKDASGKHVDPDAYHTPSRGRAFLRMTFAKLGEGMANAQAQARAEGRPVQWGDVASGAAYALGAGATSAIAVPRAPVYMQREKEIAAERARLGQGIGQRGAVAKLAEMTSQTRQRDAQTKYTLQRPLIEQAKLKFGYDKLGLDALHRERQVVASLLNRLPEFDPDAPVNADMVERLHALELPVVKKTRGQKIQFIQDQRTGEWGIISADTATGAATGGAVTDSAGKPMITVPKPVMAAEEGVRNREFKAAENEKTRENQRGIAAGRNQTSVAVAGMRGGRTSASSTRAAKLADDFAREKQLSYSAPGADARKKHMANAQAIGAVLRDNHGYEFGQDEQGNPYIKPRGGVTPQGAPAAGAYRGRRIRRANLPAARQSLRVATDEEAERILRSQGAEIIP